MKDATVEIIQEVKAHPNADRLDLVKILGFQCVAQKGLYKGGEKIIYIRPDSVLPLEEWAETYRTYSPKRVKAVKLRNEWSEGIIVDLPQVAHKFQNIEALVEGQDVCEELGVYHYEPPIPQDLSAKGGLPYMISKTDEERFENLNNKLPFGELVDVTLKIDGQSCSFYYNLEEDTFGTLSRSLEIKPDANNKYTQNAEQYNIFEKLRKYCVANQVSLCIRGESYGSGIQSMSHNPHASKPLSWAMFSVYNITERRYENKGSKHYFVNVAEELGLPYVPILQKDVKLDKELLENYSTLIENISGNYFEGVVIKHSNGSFKVISKLYDSKK